MTTFFATEQNAWWLSIIRHVAMCDQKKHNVDDVVKSEKSAVYWEPTIGHVQGKKSE